MARNALKSTTVATPVVKPDNKKGSATKAVLALIAKAVTAVRSTVQSIQQMEPIVGDAALASLRHCEKHGDAMPMDRLVKDIRAIAHPMTKAMSLEVVAWVTANSPIYWDAKGAVHVRKPDQEGYKPYDMAKAESAAFYETEQAKKARDAGAEAHAQAMKPYSFKDFFGRAMGLRKAFDSATVKDKDGNVRGIVSGDEDKIKKLLTMVEDAAKKSVA